MAIEMAPDCGIHFYIDDNDKAFLEMEEKIKTLEAQVPCWISVEERLPEECLYVIVYLQGRCNNNNKDIWHIDADYFEDGEWHRYPENGYYKPTHWMPLPEPPKEEES